MRKYYKVIKWNWLLDWFSSLVNEGIMNKVDIEKYFEKKYKMFDLKYYPEWEEHSDILIWNKIVEHEFFSDDKIVAITFNSYRQESGPLQFNGKKIKEFLEEYRTDFKEAFFSGMDLIIINTSNHYTFIFNHEGYYSNVKLPL